MDITSRVDGRKYHEAYPNDAVSGPIGSGRGGERDSQWDKWLTVRCILESLDKKTQRRTLGNTWEKEERQTAREGTVPI